MFYRCPDSPTWAEVNRLKAEGYPLSLVCRTLGLSRAGFYRRRQGRARPRPRQEPWNKALAQRIRTILDREETFGYRYDEDLVRPGWVGQPRGHP